MQVHLETHIPTHFTCTAIGSSGIYDEVMIIHVNFEVL